ncbi:hypothetical protein SEA_DARWIN_48 [Corynebacterium phage Darwin]|uniref:Uncharacterized protein n=1 Tax=Corynebacterium phage Darwin TaxID=2047869 RepID=A0A2H4P8R0_9CAUD|nr:hypothetical protein FDJ11_gp48 [Corynebacterium phage Darwin]ATW58598.1 hypothetical protein SEA_DARWIN_48 [Corynebacterium phage Darwin]
MEKIRVKTKTKKKTYLHTGVTSISQEFEGDLKISFANGLADVIYPRTTWDKVSRDL